MIFQFNNGILKGISEDLIEREFLYIHLQKRKMTNEVSYTNKFYIILNSFIDYSENFNFENEFTRQSNLSQKFKDEYLKEVSASLRNIKDYYQDKKEICNILFYKNE